MFFTDKIYRGILVIAIIAASCLFQRLGVAQAKVSDGPADDLFKFVIENTCTDKEFIELTGLEHEKCLAYLDGTANECWDLMGPYIHDIWNARDISDEQDSRERSIIVMFVLDRCIKATAIMDEGLQAKNRRLKSEDDVSGGQHYEGGNAVVAYSTWEDVIAKISADFRKDGENLDEIVGAMIDNEYRAVDWIQGRGTYVVEQGGDELPDLDTDELKYWTDLLVSVGVESAYRAAEDFVFVKDFSAKTQSHYFEAQYMTSLEPEIPECSPDLERVPCGSCEIGRFERYRAVLAWRSADVDAGRQEELMKCWDEGMSSLGFSIN